MDIRLPEPPAHPLLACNPEQLARLRTAAKGDGPARAAVAALLRLADSALAKPLEFPPRGGQHNQWYQCEPCQFRLTTIDDTHHKCESCGTVYTGEPYDDVIFQRKHSANLNGMLAAAWAHAITGEETYARHAAAVLLGYAQRYEKYPYHTSTRKNVEISGGHLAEQTLNESAHMARQIAPAYDLIHDSPVLTPADHAAIREHLLLPLLRNLDRHKGGKNNWQTWHNAAMIAGGVVLRDPEWIRKALTQPNNGFYSQMDVSVGPEGMWYENSWGYHFYTLSALVCIADAAARVGIDLWSHPNLKKMFTLPARYTMADGSLPRFGDDPGCSARSYPSLMAYGCAAYQDPNLAALLPDEPFWETVLLGIDVENGNDAAVRGSEAFPGVGHAILRTEGEAGLSAAFTFGPYGGFHGHFDKLSFVLFGHGRELGVDPGRAASQAYRLPVHTRWYKATLSHNTVLVDGQSQQPATGKLECFAAKTHYAAALARCDEAYPTVTHRRLLVLTPTYALVLDDLASDTEHRYDWIYHNRGTSAPSPVAMQEASSRDDGSSPNGADSQSGTPPQSPPTASVGSSEPHEGSPLAGIPGAEYIQNVRTGASDDAIRVLFQDAHVPVHLTLAGAPGTRILTGDGVGASVKDRVPLALITRQGRSARFAAVLEPVKANASPTVTAVELTATADAVRVTVRRGDTADTFDLETTGELTVREGDRTLLKTEVPAAK